MNKNKNIKIDIIILKLLGVIDWSWGWVLAPIWMPLCFVLVVLILLLVLFKRYFEKKNGGIKK